MKKLFLLLALCALFISSSVLAQEVGVRALLDRYYAIKVALTRDNLDSAKIAAASFAKATAIPEAKNDPTLLDLSRKLGVSAKKMQTAKNIEGLRKAFKSASTDMISVVSKYHTKGDPAAYVQYCSMQKAYWLSPEQEIRNPYYGKKMLFCGQGMRTIQ